MKSENMQFVLMGFDQDAGVRLYAFRRIVDGVHTDITVGVDLALITRYGIRIQELPLLCRELLERRAEGSLESTLTFTESEMRTYADHCASAREAAAQKRQPLQKLPPPAWPPAGGLN